MYSTIPKGEPVSDGVVSDLFDRAYEVKEDQENLNKRRGAVRDSLRGLRDAGVLSEEQSQEIDELFPPKRRNVANNEIDLSEDNEN